MLLLMVLARGQRQHRGGARVGICSRHSCGHPATDTTTAALGATLSPAWRDAAPAVGALCSPGQERCDGGDREGRQRASTSPPTATPGAGRAGAAAGQGLVLRLQLCRRWWCPGLPTCPGAAGSHGGAAGPRGACPSGSGSPRCPQLPLPSLNVTLGACQLEKRFAGDKRSGCQRRRAARS